MGKISQMKYVERTCIACPSQWNGETIDGRFVYIRYRWGNLSVTIHDGDLRNPEYVSEKICGDHLDGFMPDDLMIKNTSDDLEWSDVEWVTRQDSRSK